MKYLLVYRKLAICNIIIIWVAQFDAPRKRSWVLEINLRVADFLAESSQNNSRKWSLWVQVLVQSKKTDLFHDVWGCFGHARSSQRTTVNDLRYLTYQLKLI